MLNSLETAHPGTIVPVTPPSQNHCQEQTPDCTLPAYPQFQDGLAAAQKTFLEAYEPEELSEDDLLSELEESVSYQVTALYRKRCCAVAWEPSMFLYHLGYIIGTIHKGLSYPEVLRSALGEMEPQEVPRQVKVAPRAVGTDGWPLDM